MKVIPSRVPLILPMCGSEIDGEALNACRAVDRTLKSAGLDWHALTASIPTTTRPCCRQTPPEPRTSSTREAWQGWRDAWARQHRPSGFTEKQEAAHRAQVRYCAAEDRGRLTRRERDFITNISRRRGGLSIPQADWLGAICDRLEHEDRPAWQ